MPIEEAERASVEFLGLDFSPVSIDRVLPALARAPADGAFGYLVTPNVDHMVRLTGLSPDDPDHAGLWQAYRGADRLLCDSRVLAALARLRGVSLPVVPGSELTVRLLDDVVRPGDAISIVGGGEATLDLLGAHYPDVRFQQHVPPMGLRHDPAAMAAAAAFVAANPARFVFLAVGSPQQELLAARIKANGGATGIGLCVGAAIDFVVGAEKRAPAILQKMALEWAWRLASDPRRLWRRYLVEGPRIFATVARWRPRGD